VKLLTRYQVAKLLGVKWDAVNQWMWLGIFDYQIVDGQPLIIEKSVQDFLKNARVSGGKRLWDESVGLTQAARMLGVHRNTIRKWVRQGKLLSVVIGRSRRVPVKTLQSMLRSKAEGRP